MAQPVPGAGFASSPLLSLLRMQFHVTLKSAELRAVTHRAGQRVGSGPWPCVSITSFLSECSGRIPSADGVWFWQLTRNVKPCPLCPSPAACDKDWCKVNVPLFRGIAI